MIYSKPKDSVGFTLIELLVVIAIISLLVSILLPSLQKAKFLAKEVSCLAQMRGVGLAMLTYAQEYNGHFPPSDADLDADRGEWDNWISLILPYVGDNRKMFRCSLFDEYSSNTKIERTYATNVSERSPGSINWATVGGYGIHRFTLEEIRAPADSAMLFDIMYIGSTGSLPLLKPDSTGWSYIADKTYDFNALFKKDPHTRNQDSGAHSTDIFYNDGHVSVTTYPLEEEVFYLD